MAKLHLNTPMLENEEIEALSFPERCKFCEKACTSKCEFYPEKIALQKKYEDQWTIERFVLESN